MTGMQLFWTIVMVLGVLFIVDGVAGMGILAAWFGPSMFLIAGVPQLAIGAVLSFFGWKYSK